VLIGTGGEGLIVRWFDTHWRLFCGGFVRLIPLVLLGSRRVFACWAFIGAG
jgi:hypothetical protein